MEPWITPSLFYQFLGGSETNTAFDIYSFCEVLGPEEGNRQLRRHWDTWVTEEIIKELADSETVNSLRLPVGDFMYRPYGPYGTCSLVRNRVLPILRTAFVENTSPSISHTSTNTILA